MLLVFVAAPLLAAWGTYKITPRQKIGVGGPIISQLKLNATGAFGAYIVVMLVVKSWFFDQASIILANLTCKTAWSVEGSLVIEDGEGRKIDEPSPIEVAKATVYTTPVNMHAFTPKRFTIRLPEYDYRNTVLVVDIPRYGGGSIYFQEGNMDIKDPERKAQLKGSLVIRPIPPATPANPTSINAGGN